MKKFKFLNKISTKIALSFSLTFFLTLLILNIIVYISILNHANIIEKNLILEKKEVIFEEINSILPINQDLNDQKIKEILKITSTHVDSIYVNLKFPNKEYKTFKDIDFKYYVNPEKITEYKLRKFKINRFFYLNTKIKTPSGEYIYIQLVNDLKSTDSLIEALFSTILIIDIFVFFLSIFIGTIFAKKALAPINRISETANLINLNNLNRRIKSSNNDDEIGRLINVMNHMIERLENSFENQTKFISDASHELRTPLSIINGYADLLTQWGTTNKELTDEALTSIKEEVSNMVDLIEKLLFIAREENSKSKINLVKINLSTLLKKIFKEFKMIDKNHNYDIVQNIDLTVFLDEKLILQAIRALIENSIKYTPKNKTISISSETDNNYFYIIIKDEGIGISKEHLPKLFRRFYRVDEARTKGTGGNGLGLSIVKSIIDMHKGDILVESKINKGTQITLKLPKNCKTKSGGFYE